MWHKRYYWNNQVYDNLRNVPVKQIDQTGLKQYKSVRTTFEPRTLLEGVSKLTVNEQPNLSTHFPHMIFDLKPSGTKEYAVLLSGGVDSSVLAKLYDASNVHFIFVQTLLGQERQYFDKVAATLRGTCHIVTLDDDRYYEFAKDLYSRIDEPIGDAAIIAVYAASKYVREELHLDTMVIGEGGDEAFGGYWHYENLDYLSKKGSAPDFNYIRNFCGMAFEPPEEISAYWRFIPNEVGRGYREDYTMKAMNWDFFKALYNLFFWKNTYGCSLNGVQCVLPLTSASIVWYARNMLERKQITNSDDSRKLKIFLKDFAVRIGVPSDCVHRVKMGFRCEANPAVMKRMYAELSPKVKAYTPDTCTETFTMWSLDTWCRSLGVEL